jgi:hypothetical protein
MTALEKVKQEIEIYKDLLARQNIRENDIKYQAKIEAFNVCLGWLNEEHNGYLKALLPSNFKE